MSASPTIIKALLRTEKATLMEPAGKYLFLVDSSANKIQIRSAVEHLYKVKVKCVNTAIYRGKVKRVRYQYGRVPDSKRALVTLQKDQKIEIA